MTKTAKVLKGIRSLTEIKESPIAFIVDLILGYIISVFVPIPFITAVIKRYKKQVLFLLGGLLLVIVALPFIVWQLFITTFNQPTAERVVIQGLQGSQLLQALQ